MAEIAPLATAQSNAVHISELIRTATDVSEITARLLGTAAKRKRAENDGTSHLVTADKGNTITSGNNNEDNADDDDDDATAGASPLDAIDSDGRTAFHWCVALKRFDLANALAKKGAAVATIDFDMTSTLTTACSVDAPLELIQVIAITPPVISSSPSQPSSSASASASSSPKHSTESLWNVPDTAGNTPIMYLASRGNAKALKAVLTTMMPADVVLRYRPIERAEEAKRRYQAEHAATATASTATASAVTEVPDDTPLDETKAAGAPPAEPSYCDLFVQNNRQQTALHRAVSKGSTEFVEELIAFIKKHSAAGDTATIRHFLNAADTQGNTALHYASMENNEDMGKLLLRNGASRDAKNKKGQEFWQL